MELALALTEVDKRYPGAEFPALQHLNLRFKKGIIAGLLGPNGAGKTTTISILCGLVRPDAGQVHVLGIDISRDLASIRRKIGVVPQQIALYPELTARENLLYIGELYDLPSKALKARVDQLLHDFGLSAHAGKRISRYSGGMKRRANIIAGLLHEPDLLILDEPTTGVDVQSRTMILDFLKAYNAQGKTILYTSHLLEEAEKICDEVAIIDAGKLLAQDSPQALIRSGTDCRTLEDVFLNFTGRSVRE